MWAVFGPIRSVPRHKTLRSYVVLAADNLDVSIMCGCESCADCDVSMCAQVGDAMRCPASKFITHTLSNLTFLILLTAGTFRLGDEIHPITSTEDLAMNRFDSLTYDQQVDSQHTHSLTYLFTHLTCFWEMQQVDSLLRNSFRPANDLITNVQIFIMVWILGRYKCFLLTGHRTFNNVPNASVDC